MNLAYLAGAVAVLAIGVILARLLSGWADLALTSNTLIEPTVAKCLSNIFRYCAVGGGRLCRDGGLNQVSAARGHH